MPDENSTTPAYWAAYIRQLRDDRQLSQTDFATTSGTTQGKISRWEAGKMPPDKAADVADFARKLGRNPLEAFVAAGMLTEPEAGRGLTADDRAFLDHVASRAAGASITQLPSRNADLSDEDASLPAVASTETQIIPPDPDPA